MDVDYFLSDFSDLHPVLHQISRPTQIDPEDILRLISIRRNSGGLFFRPSIQAKNYKTKDLHELKGGDFLVSKRQVSHGALAMVRDEFEGALVSKEYTIFENRAPDILDMRYFDWLSRTKRMWHRAFVASSGVALEKLIFDPKTFLRFEIELPPIEEQRRIVKILDACDLEISLLKKKLEALREQKRGLMQRLLTGDVPAIGGEVSA